MKKFISILTAFAIAFSLTTISPAYNTPVFAEEQKILEYTPQGDEFSGYTFDYYVNPDGKTLTIINADYDFSYRDGHLIIPEKIGKYEVSAIEKSDIWFVESVSIPANSKYFKLVDDVLYTYDMETLIFYLRKGKEESFTVPKSVKHISPYSFNNTGLFYSTKLNKVNFNEGLLTIGESAFFRMVIESFSIPASVEEIGTDALNTPSLKNLQVHKDSEHFTMVDGSLLSKDLKTLVWYPNLESKTSYTIPETVITVVDQALISLRGRKIHSLKITKNVEYLSNIRLPLVENIAIDKENKHYAVKDNVLYTKDMKKLVCYPANREGSSFVVPNTVEVLGESSFWSAYNIESIKLPNNLKKIEPSAFEWSVITQITIPKRVTEIPYRCFLLSTIERITFESDTLTIGKEAFYYTELEDITLPDNTVYIGDYAFGDISNLYSITLPASIRFIGRDIFINGYVRKITVTKGSYAEQYVDKFYPDYKVVVSE
ncbi:MAG: leucine-rich repeat domain-containing protein [Oscillospiraceae bacterium]|nr:leucine-rich repeat domain-containing protein [Oscillospiraceae bacterium]